MRVISRLTLAALTLSLGASVANAEPPTVKSLGDRWYKVSAPVGEIVAGETIVVEVPLDGVPGGLASTAYATAKSGGTNYPADQVGFSPVEPFVKLSIKNKTGADAAFSVVVKVRGQSEPPSEMTAASE